MIDHLYLDLYLSLLITIDAFMDFCNFYRYRNKGWICIRTYNTYFNILGFEIGIRNDAWHWSKKLFWLVLISGLLFINIRSLHWYSYSIIIIRLALVNLKVHEFTLHKLFKRYTNIPEIKAGALV